MHMGITAENVAERYKIAREMQDQLALASQQRAAAAIAAGYFKRSRSFRSKSPRARAPCCSRKTSMCAPPPRWTCWRA